MLIQVLSVSVPTHYLTSPADSSRNTARQTHSGINKSSATVHLRTPFAPGAPKFSDSRCFIVPRCPVAARKAVTQLFARNVGE